MRGRGLVVYLRGVWDELRKVIWPTRNELWRMTWVVVATVIVFGFLIGGADFGFGALTKPLIETSLPSASSSVAPAATPTPTTALTPSSSPSASSSPSGSATTTPTP